MKLLKALLAGALTVTALAATPAEARRHDGWDNNSRHHGWNNRHRGWDRGRHNGWDRHCRWVYRHHHRVRVCR